VGLVGHAGGGGSADWAEPGLKVGFDPFGLEKIVSIFLKLFTNSKPI
jgi:hypothetical protein